MVTSIQVAVTSRRPSGSSPTPGMDLSPCRTIRYLGKRETLAGCGSSPTELRFSRLLKKAPGVIPGRAHKRVHARLRRDVGASPESRQAGNPDVLDSGPAAVARRRR